MFVMATIVFIVHSTLLAYVMFAIVLVRHIPNLKEIAGK
jgi:hypothetical protein